MRILLVHPSIGDYSLLYFRLEPIGLERIAAALLAAGHDVRLLDFQLVSRRAYLRELDGWRPEAIGFSAMYVAAVPHVIDLAKDAKQRQPGSFVFVGGHAASFLADEMLEHSQGAIDCVLRGEAELSSQQLMAAWRDRGLKDVPGAVSRDGCGPPPQLLKSLDDFLPARSLLPRRQRNKYFIAELDPCASIEFSRGCPWDCNFCSAWTFYGRSYRKVSPEAVVEDLKSIEDPNVFVVDDVAFVHPEQGMELGRAIEKAGIRKRYMLETRADVLLRNPEVFEYWARLGLTWLFFGFEAIDEEGLKALRKRVTPNKNFEALALAHKIGIPRVAINVIADPDWDHQRFAQLREWGMQIDDMIHVSIQTPYPGTETWHTESRKLTTLDYRLFDTEHAVIPTRLPLREFYKEVCATQAAFNHRYLTWRFLPGLAKLAGGLLLRGQTNFFYTLGRVLKSRTYSADVRCRTHEQPVKYQLKPPSRLEGNVSRRVELYVHPPSVVAKAAKAGGDVPVEGVAGS